MKYKKETNFQNTVFDQNMYCARMRLLFRKFCLIHGKELKSCRDGQLLNHTVPEAVYKYSVPILSPVTDNLLFLNQWK